MGEMDGRQAELLERVKQLERRQLLTLRVGDVLLRWLCYQLMVDAEQVPTHLTLTEATRLQARIRRELDRCESGGA